MLDTLVMELMERKAIHAEDFSQYYWMDEQREMLAVRQTGAADADLMREDELDESS